MSSDDKGIDVARAATIAACEAARLGTAATIAPKAPALGDAKTLYGASAGMGHDPTLMKVEDAGLGRDPTLMKVDTAGMGHDPTLMEVGKAGPSHDPTLMRVDAASMGGAPALMPTSRGVGYQRTSLSGPATTPIPQERSSSSRRVMIVAVLGAALLVALIAWAATRDEGAPQTPATVISAPPSDEVDPIIEETMPSQSRPRPDRPSATEAPGDKPVEEKGGGRRRPGRRIMRRIGLR